MAKPTGTAGLATAGVATAQPAAIRPPDRGRWRAITTPEGLDLRLRLAEASERATAFFIDIAIMAGILIAMTLLVALAVAGVGQVSLIIWLLGFFVLRNFYFALFEIRPNGATWGKRAIGIRVAARDGGRLTADAVLARNLMREIEIFLPLSFLLSQSDTVSAWEGVAGLGWTGIFALFPLFNRDRLRVGDMLAGTWVVHAPRRRLLRDLASKTAQDDRFPFTQNHTDAYGVKELHVLEDVLRLQEPKTLAAVASRIRRRIGWTAPPGEPDAAFLAAYYAALRRRLETRLLFGHRRVDKFDR